MYKERVDDIRLDDITKSMARILAKNDALDKVLGEISFSENFIKNIYDNYSQKMRMNLLAVLAASLENKYKSERGCTIFEEAVDKDNLHLAGSIIESYSLTPGNNSRLQDIICNLGSLLKENPLLCAHIKELETYAKGKIDSGDIEPAIKEKFIENLNVLNAYQYVVCQSKSPENIKKIERFARQCPSEEGVLEIDFQEIHLSKKGAERLLNSSLKNYILETGNNLQNKPLDCWSEIMSDALKYVHAQTVIRGDIEPELQKKLRKSIDVIRAHHRVIDRLVEEVREQENEDVRCGCSTFINKQQVSPEIAKLQQFARNCPATGGVFKIGSGSDEIQIRLSKEGAKKLLDFAKQIPALRRSRPSTSPTIVLASRSDGGGVSRSDGGVSRRCAIM